MYLFLSVQSRLISVEKKTVKFHVAVVLGIVGAVLWMVNLPEKHYVFWSMGLTLVASSIFLLCGILMVPDIRKFDYEYIKLKRRQKKEKKAKKTKLLQDKH